MINEEGDDVCEYHRWVIRRISSPTEAIEKYITVCFDCGEIRTDGVSKKDSGEE